MTPPKIPLPAWLQPYLDPSPPARAAIDPDFTLPEEIERIIATPHVHEDEDHTPVWLIWRADYAANGLRHFVALECVCNNIRSARNQAKMVLDDRARPADLLVERVPCNHAFGSSIPHLQMKTHYAMWTRREEMERDAGAPPKDIRPTTSASTGPCTASPTQGPGAGRPDAS